MLKDTKNVPVRCKEKKQTSDFQILVPLAEPTAKQKRQELNREHKIKAARLSQCGKKGRQASAAACLDTNRNKSSRREHPLDHLKSNREQNRTTANNLHRRSYSADDKIYRTSNKIRVCSLYGAFRILSDSVANKIGQALCKCRLCPTCQRVLARKRGDALSKFFNTNRHVLSCYYIYHFVVTLRHSRDEDVRDNLYVSELVKKFKQLRGVTGRTTEQRKWWDQRIAGGMYSVELTPGADGSPHIHLHCILLANMPLYRHSRGHQSSFIKRARLNWLELTEDSSNLYIEPIYTFRRNEETGIALRDDKGKRLKDYAVKGEASLEQLEAAFAECAKYTLKSEPEALDQFTDQFLTDLVESKNRYFGRFGCLHHRDARSEQFQNLDVLNTNFKDIEAVDEKRLQQLYNPETGEVQAITSTKIGITPFSNTRGKVAPVPVYRDERHKDGRVRGGETYYQMVHPQKVRELAFGADKHLPKALAATIYERYEPENDLL